MEIAGHDGRCWNGGSWAAVAFPPKYVLAFRLMASLSFLRTKPTSADLSPEVERFCAAQGLLSHISVALDLVRRCFPCDHEPTLQTEQDPETGEEWVAIDIRVRAETTDFLERYDRYTDEFVARIPWPRRDKIRLSYQLL